VNISADILRGKRSIHGSTLIRVNTVDLKGKVCEVDWILSLRIGSIDGLYESDSRPVRFQ
jgi:hypothetical protein